MAYPRDISIADAIKRYGLPKSHRVHWSAARKADVVRELERWSLGRADRRRW